MLETWMSRLLDRWLDGRAARRYMATVGAPLSDVEREVLRTRLEDARATVSDETGVVGQMGAGDEERGAEA